MAVPGLAVATALASLRAAVPPPRWPTDPPHYPIFPAGPGARQLQVLNGTWDFGWLGSDFDVSAIDPSALELNATATVPSAFDAAEGTPLHFSRGTAAYRTQFALGASSPAALHFGACSLWCAVYIDGAHVLSFDKGGYTPFWVDVPQSSATTRELLVVSDNRFDPDNRTASQHASYGFYQFGGILRSVVVHVPSRHRMVQRGEVTPLAGAGQRPSGQVNVSVVVREIAGGSDGVHGNVNVSLAWDGGEPGAIMAADLSRIPSTGEKAAHFLQSVPAPKLWTLASPQMHTLTIRLLGADGGVVDVIETRFGLRIVGTSAATRQVTINGVATELKGYNRHEDHASGGSSNWTHSDYLADLSIIQKSNANMIRGCHYPQDQRWLDLLDVSGVLFWEEVTSWGNSVASFENEKFMAAVLASADAMVSQSLCVPCPRIGNL